MKFFAGFFSTEGMFSILRALTLRSIRCEDSRCEAVHGYELGLHWGEWGIGAGMIFDKSEL